jgi:hypothetical protein
MKFSAVFIRERGTSALTNFTTNSISDRLSGARVVEIPSHESKPNPRVLQDIVAKQNQRFHRPLMWEIVSLRMFSWRSEPAVSQCGRSMETHTREKDYALEAKGIEPDFVCERSIAELLELV